MDAEASLADAIEALYQVFAGHTPTRATFCTFCNSEAEIDEVMTKPLREISARWLLRESADHWGEEPATYKHFLPRVLEVLAPPLNEEPLWPGHPFEVLRARGFADWPLAERQAVLRYVDAVAAVVSDGPGWTAASTSLFPAEAAVVLESHCRSRLTLPAWSVGGGYSSAFWSAGGDALLADPPQVGRHYTVEVRAPFAASMEEAFWLLWWPPLVTLNGWEPGYERYLGAGRVVCCRLRVVLERRPDPDGGQRERCHVQVVVEACQPVLDELWEEKPAADLPGVLIDGSTAVQKHLLRGEVATLVSTSMQGDINFDVLLVAGAPIVALVIDTSICQGFFYFGRARVTPELWQRLLA